MKASRFSEGQIAFVLKQAADGTAIGEVCRKAGISEATFYNWRKRYGGMMPSEVKRLRQLEEEIATPDGCSIGTLKKLKLTDKIAALTLLARHLGMLNDKLKIGSDPENSLLLLIQQVQGTAIKPVPTSALRDEREFH